MCRVYHAGFTPAAEDSQSNNRSHSSWTLTAHRGLQITEKRVGIVHIWIPVFISQIQKKKSISIQVAWCFPTQKSVMLCFWDLFITCYSQRVTSPGYSQATPWVPVQSLMPSLSRSPQLNLLSLQLCSNSQINPEIWKAASKWSHPQELASSFSQWRDGRVSTHHLIELRSRCSTLTTLSFIVRIRLWHSWDNPMKIIMVVRVDS